jgi:hypothetical protein
MFLDREGNWVSATWSYHLILVLGFMDDKRHNKIEIYLLQALAATWTVREITAFKGTWHNSSFFTMMFGSVC